MNLDYYAPVLERFPDARWAGSKGTFRCPLHQDSVPSGEFWLGRNGALLVGCWSCGKHNRKAELMAAVGVTWRDLYPQGVQPQRRRIVRTYDYRDANGNLLYQNVRFDPKDFRVRRRVSFGSNFRWAWGFTGGWYAPRPGSDCLYGNARDTDPGAVLLPEIDHCLYLLPQLLLARRRTPGRTVVVVAGEKDCETAGRVGLLATTWACGEKAEWRPQFSEPLVGADVVIVHDNDRAGEECAARVTGALMTARVGTPRSVRVGSMPGVPQKGDLTDWVTEVERKGLPVVPAAVDAFRGFRCFVRK